MIRLKNFVQDQWVEGTGGFRTLFNPATEEAVAETSSEGLDFGAILKHAHDVGGPALRAMSFEERAGLLKAMSRALYAQREALIEVAMINGGNTRKDAKFDIDGATATLSYYASLGRKLGDARILWDGESDQLTGSARFHGRHAWFPLQGAAVHINAFNFPAWGTFEKAATSILAGMPVITKPATSSAWLTYEMVKILVESDLLPAGTLQLIVGGTGDLLDRLGGQDVLAFTGSAKTGALLRGGSAPVERSTRINVEADSLNAAVLGPDLEFGSDVYFAAQRNIVTEMTQKAGQKCTAIRRVFVPEALMEPLQEAICSELDRVVVGDPRVEGVTMGPLATASQLQDYRDGVALLQEEAEIVYGSTDSLADKGYMAGPVLLRAKAGGGQNVHSHEVFGPVSTLISYDGTPEQAAALVAKGGGSLACSVYSSDKAFLSALLPELLTFNGRVLVVDKKVADTATGHGMVLPQLNHGGPGRAGGGSELGALRGLEHYMQRSAVQGNKALIERLLS